MTAALGMSIVVLDWIIKIGYLTYFLPIVILLTRFRSLDAASRWYTYNMMFHLTAGVSSEILYRNNINPNYAASVFYIFAIVLYAKFFMHVISDGRITRPLYIVMLVHIAFSATNLLFIQKETINTYSGISHSIIVISLCLIFFYRLLKQLPTENLLLMPVFWFITADFMVHTGQMLMKSFAHFLINIFNDNLIVLWVYHHGLGICGQFLVFYGIWLTITKARAAGSPS